MLFLRLKVPDLINRPAGFAVCDFVFVQEPPIAKVYADGCGEWGIRTLGTLSGTHAFQACSLSHSDNSPKNFRAQR